MALTALPWRVGTELWDGPVVVSVTRLRMRRWRDVPAFLRAALRLRAEFPREPGAVALGLAADPLRRTFWTLSAWRDEAALTAYVRSQGHVAAMRRFRRHMTDATSARWVSEAGQPSWDEALRRLETGTNRTTVGAT